MKSSDVFRKRNLSKVNFDYEDLIGRNLSDSNYERSEPQKQRHSQCGSELYGSQ